MRTPPKSEVFLADCMEVMARYPDNHFELAIVDPPYGIKATKTIGVGDTRNGEKCKKKWKEKTWDDDRPPIGYFTELRRVSRNQIVFGGNYFADLLPPSRCWIVWDKMQRIDQADAELAWTSFSKSVRVYQYHASLLMGFQNPQRFHPTEKPIDLYLWLIQNYAKEGDKILDTHLGSGSSRIAAHRLGFDFVGCEIDKDYFDAAQLRFERETKQSQMF